MNIRIEPSSLADPKLSFETTPSGISIPHVDVGSGEPLLFVHGSLCDYRYWNAQITPLSKDFQCIAPSLSHYWPAAEAAIQSDFSWETHVTELADFIVALDIEPVHLVGHPRVGSVAFQLACKYPRLVKPLTLPDPAGPLQLDDTTPAALPAATNLELFVDSVSMPGFWRKSTGSFRTMAIDNARTLPLQFRDALPTYSHDLSGDITCRTLPIDGRNSPRMFRNTSTSLRNGFTLPSVKPLQVHRTV